MSAGSVCGCLAGNRLSGQIAGSIGPASYYDTAFSNGSASQEEPEQTEAGNSLPSGDTILDIAGILLAGSLISGAGIWLNLREEPMEMLGKKRNE